MKKTILSIALVITCLHLKSQNLYVFNTSFINKIGNSEAYNNATEDENRSKFDSWPILEAGKAVKSVELDPANANHPFDLVLELDENMHTDLKKYFFGKTDKFEKKYPKKFSLAIFLNNHVFATDISTANIFNQYPNISENNTEPDNYKFFKGPNGRFTMCYRNVLETYTLAMKEKIIDGANEIKFVVSYDGKEYANTTIIYNINKFNHNSDYCGLGEQKCSDADYYKQCSSAYQKAFPNHKLEEIIFSYKTMQVRKKDALPYVRYNSALVIQTSAEGKLYLSGITFKEMYNKNGSWDSMVLEEIIEFPSQELDQKCLESYRKAMGK